MRGKHKFDDVEFRLDLGEPPRDVLDWSRDNLGENDDDRSIKVHELREIIYERGDVMPHRMDDAFLLRFLRARSFNIESSYRLLVNYYNFKEDNPELHENVNPMDQRAVGDDDVIQVLPYREQTGRRIMIYKLGNWKTTEYNVDEMFKATLALLELGILEPRAQILGGICIFDMKDITMSHARQMNPTVARKIIQLMVTSFPLKVHALHIVFESKVFDVFYNIFKPFLSARMKKKIFFHGNDMDSLHSHIDPKYLPKRYGGVKPNYRYNRWIEGFRTDKQICQEMTSLGYILDEAFLNQRFTNSDDEKTDSD